MFDNKLPWKSDPDTTVVYDADGSLAAIACTGTLDVPEIHKDACVRAEFITRAVNAVPEMVATLELMLEHDNRPRNASARKIVEDALVRMRSIAALAKGSA